MIVDEGKVESVQIIIEAKSFTEAEDSIKAIKSNHEHFLEDPELFELVRKELKKLVRVLGNSWGRGL